MQERKLEKNETSHLDRDQKDCSGGHWGRAAILGSYCEVEDGIVGGQSLKIHRTNHSHTARSGVDGEVTDDGAVAADGVGDGVVNRPGIGVLSLQRRKEEGAEAAVKCFRR